MRILIVEDEKRLAQNLAELLRRQGYTVDVSSDGVSGYDNAVTDIYDLILLDAMLPGMDGFTLLRRLRTGGHAVPVLMLTARSELSDRVRGLDCGADYYLTKPFESEELLACIRSLLRRSGDEVSAERRRLTLFGELTVAVIHNDRRIRAAFLYRADDLSDLRNSQRAPGSVPAASLHKCCRGAQLRYAPRDPGVVRTAVRSELQLFVPDAERSERTAAGAGDGGMERIVRCARDSENRVARLQRAVQRAGNGVCAVYKRGAHERRFRAKNISIHLLQRLTSEIVIAIAGRPGKARLGDAVRAERIQHALRIPLRRALKAAEYGLKPFFHLPGQRIKLFVIHGSISFISVR